VDKIKTHISCSVTFFFNKILPFMRSCGKILQSRAAPGDNTAHAFCMLDT